ncbi:hypothetical protein SDC9_07887 [bioreactor metagenome]|uniref:Uncharacterized protein n=1 Tax=bioreactor metagenome TaxID=1076179 RepID=A0A644T5R2_9ZZZZ|nr:hypothetical protein [Candidatus Elulimicrobiales bacterium]
MESLSFHISEILEYFASKDVNLRDAYLAASFFKNKTLTLKVELTLEEAKTRELISDFLKEKNKKLISFSMTRDRIVCYVKQIS